MKFLTKLLTTGLATALLLPTLASAGSATGTVKYLVVRASDGLIYVALNGAWANRPQCALGTVYWVVPNENSETGKKLYATLLAAKLSGETIQIIGRNFCDRWPDGEDIDYISVGIIQ